MTAGVQPTDPAVQAAIEAGARHSVPTPSLGIQCSCGADILTLAEREEHFTTVRVEAARPIIEAEVRAPLDPFRRMVSDLDRNENGRHEGDADVGDPSGVSQGNPRMKTGDVIGYMLGGHPYVMPPRGKRHDPAAWIARRAAVRTEPEK
jgi:hypothetical protein